MAPGAEGLGSVKPHWWRGTRGEWYVVVQVGLITLVLLGPRTGPGWPEWTPPWTALARGAAGVLLVAGSLLCLGGALKLGANLTPLPYPTDRAALVETGAYRVVRHPMYCGVLALTLSWALWRRGWLTLAYAGLAFAFLNLKSRREERWLCARFPAYADYQRRVRRLIPFVY